mmetsp:Transcript_6539/g.15120  ORF Transcript_6539/g.15120 Transcript_6539/m.15120 type:complete len:438 (+) Transcript_6539:19-1332(+)
MVNHRLVLFVAAFLLATSDTLSRHSTDDDLITSLPGYGVPKETQYAGYIPVNKTASLFYWFVGAQESNDTTPLVVWINGGPGASSLTGCLAENGPFTLQPNLTLVDNPFSWNRHAHMLYIDQPVGTGFSFVGSDDEYATTEDEVAVGFYSGLQGFYAKHPEYRNATLFLTGESYAGKYLPAIAEYIVEQNSQSSEPVPLEAVAIGNGLVNPPDQFSSMALHAYNLGLIDEAQLSQATAAFIDCVSLANQGQWVQAYNVCNGMSDTIFKWAGDLFLYDIRQHGNPFAELTSVMRKYLNQTDVKEALHVGDHVWTSGDGGNPVADHLMNEFMQPLLYKVPPLLQHVRILFYSGQFDGSCCNPAGSRTMLRTMPWPFQDEFNNAPRTIWSVDGLTAGYAKSAANLTEVLILDSGHLVPCNQPAVAYEMLTRFIAGAGWGA